MSVQKAVLVLLLLFGAYLISTKGQGFYPQFGDIIIVCAAFFSVIANILAKKIMKENSHLIVSIYRAVFGGLIILIIIPFFIQNWYIIQDPTLLIARSIFSFLTILFLNKTIQETTVSYASMMSMMYSVFVAIFGFMFLRETMNLFQIIGAIIIIVSSILIQKSKIHLSKA